MTRPTHIKYLPAFAPIREVARQAYRLSAIIFLPALMAACLSWIIQKPSLSAFSQTRTKVLNVEPGEVAQLNNQMVVDTDTKKALYEMWLEDAAHNVVYRYPSRVIRDPGKLVIGDRAIAFPRTLQPGVYLLMVQVQYQLNPLKTAAMTVELARVEVVATR